MGQSGQLARERELEELVARGHFDKAALVARALGQTRYAAKLFEDAKLPYQAAVCAYEAGDPRRALTGFLSVPKADPRYRAACVHVLRIATELNVLSEELAAYVSEFAASEPKDPHDVRALYRLGVLYQAHELFDHARDVLKRVCRIDPTNADAKQRVSILEGLVRGAPAVYEKIIRQDAAAWRGSLSGGPAAPLPHPSPPPPAVRPAVAQARDSRPHLIAVDQSESWSVATEYDAVGPSFAVPVEAVAQPARARPNTPAGTTMASRTSAPPPATADVVAGTVVAGRYRVEREVGRGGMGVVYHATDLELDEAIAIKLFSQRLDLEGLVHRFKQELSLTRQLAHPNIVRLYDIGAHGGRKFISMELLDGMSLGEAMEERRPTLREALNILWQTCQGLGAAHALGVVHRDVKPDNLFLTKHGMVKVTDFGLAKKQGDAGVHTMAGFIAGSPNYMAPEQITDFGSVTPAADMYSLGVVAYELFAGTRPFVHDDRQKLFEMHLTAEAVRPSTLVTGLLPSIDRLVLDLLRKDPKERPSCEMVLARLEKFDVVG